MGAQIYINLPAALTTTRTVLTNLTRSASCPGNKHHCSSSRVKTGGISRLRCDDFSKQASPSLHGVNSRQRPRRLPPLGWKLQPRRTFPTPNAMRTEPRSMSVVAPVVTDLVESAKRLAAFQAVEEHLNQGYKYIGIGSGSTVVHVVDAIVGKGSAFYAHMTFTPTGSQSRQLIKKAGLTLCNLDDRPMVDGRPVLLDVAFDGTDEVDEELNLIKGGGGCLFQEKLVVVAAKKFVAVADSRKRSERLCTNWRTIPIEILPVAAPDVLARLRALGCIDATIRSGLPSKAGECVTDNGMWIVDAAFPPLLLSKDLTSETDGKGENGRWHPDILAAELLKTPGIVECGLFIGLDGDQVVQFDKQRQAQKPVAVYFGLPNGEVQVHRRR